MAMKEIVERLGCGKRLKADVCGKHCYLCPECAPKYQQSRDAVTGRVSYAGSTDGCGQATR